MSWIYDKNMHILIWGMIKYWDNDDCLDVSKLHKIFVVELIDWMWVNSLDICGRIDCLNVSKFHKIFVVELIDWMWVNSRMLFCECDSRNCVIESIVC